MRIAKLLEKKPLFFKEKTETHLDDHIKKITSLSRSHTSTKGKKDTDESFSQRRPSELKSSQAWRDSNYRQFLKADFTKFLWKSSRIFDEIITPQNRSEVLNEWLESKPFTILHQSAGEQEYKEKIYYPKALANPMRVGPIPFPYLPGFGTKISPLDGQGNRRVLPRPMIIEFDDICYIDKDGTFSFFYEEIEFKDEKGKLIKKGDRFFSVDDRFWYVHDPVLVKKDGKYEINHETSLWYAHNSFESLFNLFPGKVEESWNGEFECLTSLIDGFFEIAEEAKQAFSDEKIVRTLASYPIRVIIPQECTDHNCNDGWDRELVAQYGKKDSTKCKSCGGHGKIMAPNPAGYYIKNSVDNSFVDPISDKNKNSEDPIQFLGPDLSYPDFAYKVAWDLATKARKALWLDVMDGAGLNASAEALSRRQEDFKDAMHMIAKSISKPWDRFLWGCECILVRYNENNDRRIRPTTLIPSDISIKSATELLNEAKETFAENTIFAKDKAYGRKYRDDQTLRKIHRIILCSYPVFSLKDELRVELIAQKCLPKKQQFAQLVVPFILKQMSLKPGFDNKADDQILNELKTEVDKQFKESDIQDLEDSKIPLRGVEDAIIVED